MVLTFGGQSVTLDFQPDDRTPGTAFDRFGLMTIWIDGNAQTIDFDDLSYTVSRAEGGRD
jgi:hypothetical protein